MKSARATFAILRLVAVGHAADRQASSQRHRNHPSVTAVIPAPRRSSQPRAPHLRSSCLSPRPARFPERALAVAVTTNISYAGTVPLALHRGRLRRVPSSVAHEFVIGTAQSLSPASRNRSTHRFRLRLRVAVRNAMTTPRLVAVAYPLECPGREAIRPQTTRVADANGQSPRLLREARGSGIATLVAGFDATGATLAVEYDANLAIPGQVVITYEEACGADGVSH